MRRFSLVISVGMLVAASTALATTYVRVEKDGTKTYSDRPLPGGQPIELTPAQTYSAPPAPAAQSSVPLEQRLLGEVDDFRYTSCETTPKTDETFTNPDVVNVGVVLQPLRRPSDIVELSVDGAVVGNTTSFTMQQPVNRGTHTVSVTVKDRFGRTLCSASSTFHVFRPSLNMPGRR
jgi:hypothetical protein